ncbi:hypothetical protein OQA88_12566 [Cercophora sp. LCS_1]
MAYPSYEAFRFFASLRSSSLRDSAVRAAYYVFSVGKRRSDRLHTSYRAAAADALLGRPWFQRAWTFHEYLLSTSPVFLYGDRSVANHHLLGALESPSCQERTEDGLLLGPKMTSSVSNMQELATVALDIARPTRDSPTLRTQTQGLIHPDYVTGGHLALILLYIASSSLALSICLFVFVVTLGLPIAAPLGTTPTLAGAACGIALGIGFLAFVARNMSLDTPEVRRSHCHVTLTFTPSDAELSTEYANTPVASVLQAIRSRAVTNPKDRSFAVHGVLSRLGKPEMVNLILDAGWSRASSTASSNPHQQPQKGAAPTWVPDWSVVAIPRPDNTPNGTHLFDFDRLYHPAEGSSTANWPVTALVHNNELHVRGILTRRIQVFGNDLAAWIHEVRQTASAKYGSIPDVVGRVLRASVWGVGGPGPGEEWDADWRVIIGRSDRTEGDVDNNNNKEGKQGVEEVVDKHKEL